MSSHEIVCLSSDEEEKNNLPVIVSTRSVASLHSTVEILSDSEDILNGNTEIKEEGNKINSDHAGPSSTSGPPAKKLRMELITVDKAKPAKSEGAISPKKKSRKAILVEENTVLFNALLKKCEEIICSQDMKKGTAKAQKHFECAQIEFISSKEFKNRIENTLTKVDKDCVWGHLGEIVKELKLYKEREGDLTGSQKEKDEMKEQLASTDKDRYYQVLKNEEDERIVAKLTKILKKIHKQILKLEEQEVDFEDDDDSSYIMLERYKARAVKIYEKLSKYTNYPEHADRMSKRKITFSGTDIIAVNKCIERFINKNFAFPDYCDVLKLIQTVNTSDSLGLPAHTMELMAKKAFHAIGTEMKKRRQWDVEDSLFIHLDRENFDSKVYENNAELESKLTENGKKFVENINKVMDEYTLRQEQEQQKHKKERPENGDKSGASSEVNSGGEESDKEDGDESDDESSNDEKPVEEEFESDNERDSEGEDASADEGGKEEKRLSVDEINEQLPVDENKEEEGGEEAEMEEKQMEVEEEKDHSEDKETDEL